MKLLHSIRIVCYLFFSSSLFFVSWGQTKPLSASTTAPISLSIEGTIVDAATHKPIAGADISVTNQAGTISDRKATGPDGVYKLILGSKESFLLSVNANGYEPFTQQLAPTSAYTNKILGKLLELHRINTQPMHTNAATIVQPAPPASTSAIASTPTPSTPAVALQEVKVTGNGKTDSGQTGNERVTPPKTLDAKVVYTPPLVVAPTGKTTQLRAIQFVQSKAELLPDAQPALEQLLTFLRDKPTVEIELAGHTDNQGDFDQNLLLSKQRVDVVKAYLVQNGIATNRITTRGYGPTRPIASNNSEATRQLNRRVELIVVKQ